MIGFLRGKIRNVGQKTKIHAINKKIHDHFQSRIGPWSHTLVEVTGLEPAASWSQTKHSTKLSYTSLFLLNLICTTKNTHKLRHKHFLDYIIKMHFCQAKFTFAFSNKVKFGFFMVFSLLDNTAFVNL